MQVLVVDDHPLVLAGLEAIFRQSPPGYQVLCAANGSQALALAAQHHPEVAVVDWCLPDCAGAVLVGQLRQACPALAVLVLSAFAAPLDVLQAWQAGARGYLSKEASAVEILQAVETVAKGGRVLPAPLAEALTCALEQPKLSSREHQVLQLLAKGLDNGGMARTMGVSVVTVKTHMAHLLEKLQARDRTQLLIKALHLGWVKLTQKQ